MSWVFYISASFNWKKKNLRVRCYQHSHFIEEETEARGINEVASMWKRNFLGAYISTLSKIHGNGHWLYILWAKLISISILSIKKKQN